MLYGIRDLEIHFFLLTLFLYAVRFGNSKFKVYEVNKTEIKMRVKINNFNYCIKDDFRYKATRQGRVLLSLLLSLSNDNRQTRI